MRPLAEIAARALAEPSRRGYEQAAALLTQAQVLLDGREDLGLLVELGNARLRAGQPRCLETFGAAADRARAAGDATAFAEAALGLAGRFSTPETGSTDVAVLEEALATLDPSDAELRVRVLSRLAQSAPEARRGSLPARRARWPSVSATTAPVWPRWRGGERPPSSFRSPTGSATSRPALGRHWLLQELTAAGDRAGALRELAVLTTLADRLHQPLYHELVSDWQAQLASPAAI